LRSGGAEGVKSYLGKGKTRDKINRQISGGRRLEGREGAHPPFRRTHTPSCLLVLPVPVPVPVPVLTLNSLSAAMRVSSHVTSDLVRGTAQGTGMDERHCHGRGKRGKREGTREIGVEK
jgi:hypothetical protein